jgi:ribosome maturation protein SDO1
VPAVVSVDEAVVARYEAHGERFELLVDPKIMEKLAPDASNLTELLAADKVYRDSHKGSQASSESLQKVFNTTDFVKCALAILKKGEVQLTTEQRRELTEAMRRKVVAEIVRNAINPQTKGPHPPSRIETAMEEARVHIDPFKPVEAQVKEVIDALKPLIPIRVEKAQLAVRVSGENYGKIYNDLHQLGTLKKEEWTGGGAWIGVLEVPAGMVGDVMDRLNERTKGDVEIRKLDKPVV